MTLVDPRDLPDIPWAICTSYVPQHDDDEELQMDADSDEDDPAMLEPAAAASTLEDFRLDILNSAAYNSLTPSLQQMLQDINPAIFNPQPQQLVHAFFTEAPAAAAPVPYPASPAIVSSPSHSPQTPPQTPAASLARHHPRHAAGEAAAGAAPSP
jgi:hypothetical protein